jgi:hypothetical protein
MCPSGRHDLNFISPLLASYLVGELKVSTRPVAVLLLTSIDNVDFGHYLDRLDLVVDHHPDRRCS